MQKILVPCDGSANAVRAVRYAADLAKKLPGAQLDLLYVEDPVLMRNCAVLAPEERKNIQCKEADRILCEAREALKAAGMPYQEAIRTGPPANEIALYVQENGCDAVIMGTRGLGPLASVLIGSVATQTVHLVHVPVTLVK
jgi:nucleotide-binding universal stress UspA family protein